MAKLEMPFCLQFHLTSAQSAEDDLRQVSTLLHCMGEEVNDTLNLRTCPSQIGRSMIELLPNLTVFFEVRKKVIFERAHFK